MPVSATNISGPSLNTTPPIPAPRPDTPTSGASSVQADFSGVSNAPSRFLRAIGNLVSHIGHSFRDAFHSIANALTSCFRADPGDSRNVAHPAPPELNADITKVLLEMFKDTSKRFDGLLRDPVPGQLGPSLLNGREAEYIINSFRAVSAALHKLAEDRSGLSETVRTRMMEVANGEVINDLTIEKLHKAIDKATEANKDLLSTTDARMQLRAYLGEVRSVLVAAAKETGDDGLVKDMEGLFPDERVNKIVDELGMKGTGGGQYDVLNKDPRYVNVSTSALGARYGNKTAVDTRIELADGSVYAGANKYHIAGMDGAMCFYPRVADLPSYFAMLFENARDGVITVNVLMAASEIEDEAKKGRIFPRYFSEDGSYGDFDVTSEEVRFSDAKRSWQVGSLDVGVYNLHINSGGKQVVARVNHVENWRDFAGVDAKSLREFVKDYASEGPFAVNHCRGGLGRAATTVAAMAVYAGMDAQDAISAVRRFRAPEAVQVIGQVANLVDIQRLGEVESWKRQESETIYQNAGEQSRGHQNAAYVNDIEYESVY